MQAFSDSDDEPSDDDTADVQWEHTPFAERQKALRGGKAPAMLSPPEYVQSETPSKPARVFQELSQNSTPMQHSGPHVDEKSPVSLPKVTQDSVHLRDSEHALEDMMTQFDSATAKQAAKDAKRRVKGYARYQVTQVCLPGIIGIFDEKVSLNSIQLRVDSMKLPGSDSTTFQKQEAWIILEDEWALAENTPVEVGHILHFIGDMDPVEDLLVGTVSATRNFMVLLPDILLSPSTITKDLQCERPFLLSAEFANLFAGNEAASKGNLVHDLVQTAMRANNFSNVFLHKMGETLVLDKAIELCEAGMSQDDAMAYVEQVIQNIEQFQTYFTRTLTPLKFSRGDIKLRMLNTNEIEEAHYSVQFGLNGKIDASVDVEIELHNQPKQVMKLPLEIKSGKSVRTEFYAQIQLYTLMMQDRYDGNVVTGLLLHLNENRMELQKIPVNHVILSQLVQKRNRLAVWKYKYHRQGWKTRMPPMLHHPGTCSRCFHKTECAIYHRIHEDGDEHSSGMHDADFRQQLIHFNTPERVVYFRKWMELLDKETYAVDLEENNQGFWLKDKAISECLYDLHVLKVDSLDAQALVTFEVFTAGGIRALKECRWNKNQFVRLSIDQGEWSVYNFAQGMITRVDEDKKRVVVRLSTLPGDQFLLRDRKEQQEHHNTYASIPSFSSSSSSSSTSTQNHAKNASVEGNYRTQLLLEARVSRQRKYRLDVNSFGQTMKKHKENVLKLFHPKQEYSQAKRLRQVLVDSQLHENNYETVEYFMQDGGNPLANYIMSALDDFDELQLFQDFESLNIPQQRAILRVLTCNDFSLIVGMPGAGKSHTIVMLLRVLAALNQSVLLVAYQHSAVDTVLIKLLKELEKANVKPLVPDPSDSTLAHPTEPQFIRLGKRTSVDPLVQKYVFKAGQRGVDYVSNTISKAKLVACTTLDKLQGLRGRIFDYVIVDEAGQCTEPNVLGPLLQARKFVLVGDPKQIRPIAKSDEAIKEGYAVSLMERLTCLDDGKYASKLNLQYRMNADICAICSQVFYNNELQCGSSAVAEATLTVYPKHTGHPDSVISLQDYIKQEQYLSGELFMPTIARSCEYRSEQWLDLALHTQTSTLLLDTSDLKTAYEARDNGYMNQGEVYLVLRLVARMLRCGVKANTIGVITPMNKQVDCFKHHISELQRNVTIGLAREWQQVYVSTVDKYQGKDKKCIILSYVRNNSTNNLREGCLQDEDRGHRVGVVEEKARLNVALSRAKHKMVFVGAQDTLQSNDTLRACLKLFKTAHRFSPTLDAVPAHQPLPQVSPFSSSEQPSSSSETVRMQDDDDDESYELSSKRALEKDDMKNSNLTQQHKKRKKAKQQKRLSGFFPRQQK